jgi:putative Holliday junction resolvase
MRVLGLDHGSARCGVAASDASGTIATPVTVVDRPDSEAGMEAIAQSARNLGAQLIVVGLPLRADGQEGEQARVARSFAGRLRKAVECDVELFDERFTTRMAQRNTAAGAVAPEDAMAAAHMLQSYLDSRQTGEAIQ